MVHVNFATKYLGGNSQNYITASYLTPLDKIKASGHPCASYWYEELKAKNVHDIFALLSYIQIENGYTVKDFAAQVMGITRDRLYTFLNGYEHHISRERYQPKLTGLIPNWILEIYFEDNERFKRY